MKTRTERQQTASGDDLPVGEVRLAHESDDLGQNDIAKTDSFAVLTGADNEAAVATAELRVFYDSMTALPNRDLFNDRLAHAISLADRHDWTLAVMFLDLDHFSNINDRHGFRAGDRVLKEVAQRLLDHSREEDTVCRNRDDEFLYLLMNPQGTESIGRIASQILKNIGRPIDIDDVQLVITTSIGIAVYPNNGTTGEQLIRNADAAMSRAKERLGGGVFVHAAEMGK